MREVSTVLFSGYVHVRYRHCCILNRWLAYYASAVRDLE